VTISPDDEKTGYKQPPLKSRWRKGQSGNPRRKPSRPETALEMVDRILRSPVTVTSDGETKRMPALEAIVSQLQIMEMAGNIRASRILLEYRKFAGQNAEKEVQLIFLQNEDSAESADLTEAEHGGL
jgi:hypothetical protein